MIFFCDRWLVRFRERVEEVSGGLGGYLFEEASLSK